MEHQMYYAYVRVWIEKLSLWVASDSCQTKVMQSTKDILFSWSHGSILQKANTSLMTEFKQMCFSKFQISFIGLMWGGGGGQVIL
jgi:hypothetical protein